MMNTVLQAILFLVAAAASNAQYERTSYQTDVPSSHYYDREQVHHGYSPERYDADTDRDDDYRRYRKPQASSRRPVMTTSDFYRPEQSDQSDYDLSRFQSDHIDRGYKPISNGRDGYGRIPNYDIPDNDRDRYGDYVVPVHSRGRYSHRAYHPTNGYTDKDNYSRLSDHYGTNERFPSYSESDRYDADDYSYKATQYPYDYMYEPRKKKAHTYRRPSNVRQPKRGKAIGTARLWMKQFGAYLGNYFARPNVANYAKNFAKLFKKSNTGNRCDGECPR